MVIKIGRCLLRDQLHKRGLTPTYLSEKLGMSLTQISDYMNDRRGMSLQTAVNIAYVIGCQVHELYEWHEERHQK